MKLKTIIGSPLRIAFALSAVIALSASIGVASGAIPSRDGTISGCVASNGGALRAIDTATQQQCKTTEQPLVWSQRGPQGPKGTTGAQGVRGLTGATGPQGPKGAPGQVALSVHTANVNINAGEFGLVSVSCPANQRATGGGFVADGGVPASESQPVLRTVNGASVPVGWAAVFHNTTANLAIAQVNVVCTP